MIVFKTFLKVLKKCSVPILMYTIILVIFGGFNMTTQDNQISFTNEKPDIFIINEAKEEGIVKTFIDYINENSNIKDINNEQSRIDDALFFRDVNYIIYIPKNFREDFLNGKNPEIKIKSTGDYMASLSNILVERFMNVANIYQKANFSEDEIIKNVKLTLDKQLDVKMTTSLDTNKLEKISFYYNFTNYCLLAGCIYVICLILSSFKSPKVNKRIIVSSMNYKEFNRNLLLSNSLFAFLLWLFYVILSIILVGNIVFTIHGFYYILNSFIFTICVLCMAFLIGNLIINKNAINGIVNVIALGSSFLCGSFVPMEFLPDFVLKIAHIFPSYYFIKTNELLKNIEIFNFKSLKPIIINMSIILLFAGLFIVITNIISKKKQKIA